MTPLPSARQNTGASLAYHVPSWSSDRPSRARVRPLTVAVATIGPGEPSWVYVARPLLSVEGVARVAPAAVLTVTVLPLSGLPAGLSLIWYLVLAMC